MGVYRTQLVYLALLNYDIRRCWRRISEKGCIVMFFQSVRGKSGVMYIELEFTYGISSQRLPFNET